MVGERKPESRYVKMETMLIVALVAAIAGFLGGVVFSSFKLGPDVPFHPDVPKQQAAQGGGPSEDDLVKIATLEKETSQDPENLKAWIDLGNLYFDTNMFEKAIHAYNKALELGPRNANVWTDLGIMYRRNGEANEAVRAFEKAMEADPRHEASRFNKGVVLMHDLDDPEGAMKAWEDLLQVNPLAMAPNGQAVIDLVQRMREGVGGSGSK